MPKMVASFCGYKKEWSFSVFKVSDTEFRIYQCRDHNGSMFDLTRGNRWKLGLIATFDHFPTWDEVDVATAEWQKGIHPAFAFMGDDYDGEHYGD
jgi:hypothetical protein